MNNKNLWDENDTLIQNEIKRIRRRSLFLFICIIVIPILFGCYKTYYFLFERLDNIVTSVSPNKVNQIIISEKGTDTPFYSAPIIISFVKQGNLKKYGQYHIANGWKSITSNNFNFEWKDDNNVEITLSGEYQKDEIVDINLKNNH